MDIFSRRDTSIIGRWWWTVDRWSLVALLCIIIVGVFMSFSASPSVAKRIAASDPYFFVKRHLIMLGPAILVFCAVSMMNALHVRRMAFFLYGLSIVLLIATLLFGIEIKGAKRWLHLGGFSLQASELVKPSLAVLSAWMLAEKYRDAKFPGVILSLGFMGLAVMFLLLQPDLGMTCVVIATWLVQIFVAGLPIIWFVIMAGGGVAALIGAYFFMPHVSKRIDQFFSPQSTDDLYQVNQSLEAFMQGGWIGCGPGEGVVKRHVPDAHADFVFSVIGEEFGLWMCLLIVGFYGVIILRSLIRAVQSSSLFVLIGTTGLSIQLGVQAFINMASTLHLIPTKGMTMPFISYGGSSMLALGVGVGMLFALTRRHHGWVDVV